MNAETPDEELMARVGGGDVFAYTIIVERHLPSVYRGAYRMLRDRHEAEDIAQESFERLWRNAPRWQSRNAGVPAWLKRVSMNLCLDCLRKRRRWAVGEPPDIADPAISVERMIELGQTQEVLEACLEALSDAHRAAIVLTYYVGYSNKAAAELLSLDLKAFESLLYRSRRKLGLLLSMSGIMSHDAELLA